MTAQVDPAHSALQVAGTDHKAGCTQSAAGHHDVALLARDHQGATGAELAAKLHGHGPANFHQLALEVQSNCTVGCPPFHRQAVGAGPVQGGGVGLAKTVLAQAEVQTQFEVLTRHVHTKGGGAQDIDRVGHTACRHPRTCVAIEHRAGDHQTKVQAIQGKTQTRSIGAGADPSGQVFTTDDEGLRHHTAATGQRQLALTDLKAHRTTEREHIAHLGIDRATGSGEHTLLSIERELGGRAGAGTHRHRGFLEIDDVGIRAQARGQILNPVEIDCQRGGRQGHILQAHQFHSTHAGRQAHP